MPPGPRISISIRIPISQFNDATLQQMDENQIARMIIDRLVTSQSENPLLQRVVDHMIDARSSPSPRDIRLWEGYRMLEMRFARALAELDTYEIDAEIAGRVAERPREWVWLLDRLDLQPLCGE